MYIPAVNLAAVAFLILAQPVPAAPSSTAEAARAADELWKRRDDPTALAAQQKVLDGAVARAPGDYGVLWRAARLHFWLSDDPALPAAERSRIGKLGWDLAERAVAARPDDVAGHYWAMANIGNYALGLGVVSALAGGMEGKFRARLERAAALNAGYEHGGIDAAWGRFYAKLPWPLRDAKRAAAHFRRVTDVNPYHLRARVYWADLQLDQDNPREAKRLLEEVAAAPGDKYDGPEERRAKLMAARLMPKIAAALK